MAEPVVPSTFVPNEVLIHQNLQNDPAIKAQQIVDSAPHLANEPQTVMALANHPNVDGHTLASVAQLTQHVAHEEKLPIWVKHGPTNTPEGEVYPDAAPSNSFLNQVAGGFGSAIGGIVHSIPSLVNTALELMNTNRPMEQAIEGQSVPQIQKEYLNATNTVNPIIQMQNMRSTIAMYEMLKQTKGTAYATSWLTTNLAAAIATKKIAGIGSAEDVAATARAIEESSAAADNKIFNESIKRKVSGETLTQAEQDAADQANHRIVQRDLASALDRVA